MAARPFLPNQNSPGQARHPAHAPKQSPPEVFSINTRLCLCVYHNFAGMFSGSHSTPRTSWAAQTVD